MARADRIQVTVSLPMRVALVMLARRNGVTPSTQATMLLRQALDRTIASAAGQIEIKRARGFQTVAQWREDRASDRQVEAQYGDQVARRGLEEIAFPDEAPGHGTLDHIRLAQEREGR